MHREEFEPLLAQLDELYLTELERNLLPEEQRRLMELSLLLLEDICELSSEEDLYADEELWTEGPPEESHVFEGFEDPPDPLLERTAPLQGSARDRRRRWRMDRRRRERG